jgi:hypothetical protein
LLKHWATRDDLTAMLQLGVVTAPRMGAHFRQVRSAVAHRLLRARWLDTVVAARQAASAAPLLARIDAECGRNIATLWIELTALSHTLTAAAGLIGSSTTLKRQVGL